MEYNMNLLAKLLHTSISRLDPERNIIKIYGNIAVSFLKM